MTKQEFWLWFEEHLTDLEKLIISQSVDYSIYDALTEKLTQFDKHLIPEITMDEQERYILILSCDGNREGMNGEYLLSDNPFFILPGIFISINQLEFQGQDYPEVSFPGSLV